MGRIQLGIQIKIMNSITSYFKLDSLNINDELMKPNKGVRILNLSIYG